MQEIWSGKKQKGVLILVDEAGGRLASVSLFHSGIRHSLYARTSSLVEGGNLRFFWDVLLPSVISQHMLS